MALNSRALYQYGAGGGGGVCWLKKIFGNSPCQFSMSGGESYFCIRYIKKGGFFPLKKKNVLFVYYKNPKNIVICMHR